MKLVWKTVVTISNIPGWGGRPQENFYIDEIGAPDTVLDFRYNAIDVALDNHAP